jgi:hypothetical protein
MFASLLFLEHSLDLKMMGENVAICLQEILTDIQNTFIISAVFW